jgi:hypothetical protein
MTRPRMSTVPGRLLSAPDDAEGFADLTEVVGAVREQGQRPVEVIRTSGIERGHKLAHPLIAIRHLIAQYGPLIR